MKSATSNTSERAPAERPRTVAFDTASLPRLLTSGWAGAIGLVLLELLFVLLKDGRAISSVWELQVGLVGLLPAWALLALPAGLMAAVLAKWIVIPPTVPNVRSKLGAGILVGVASFAVGWGVGGRTGGGGRAE